MANYKIMAIKLFLSDVDGVLTDGGMYYSERGDELKKFNTRDGMGFQLVREAGLATGIITSENTELVTRRAKKLRVDYLFQGKRDGGKLEAARAICDEMGIDLGEVAYIGDDLNCVPLLRAVGRAACPADAMRGVRALPNVQVLEKSGGQGCVREWAELLLEELD